MPEGDTIFRTARTLDRALAGWPVTRFETVLPHLARVEVDLTVTGRAVENVEARGKWVLVHLSGDLVLLTHMRIVLGTERIWAVAFNVQVAEFHSAASLKRRAGLNALGPSLLTPSDDGAAVARLRASPDLEIATALMKQSLLAGIGNVFKSEICFVAGVHPFRLVRSLADDQLRALVSTARKLLQANVADMSDNSQVTYRGLRSTTGRRNPEERLWVYHRAGQPCRRCGEAIDSYRQGPDARTTFWCPRCQPAPRLAGRARS